MSSALANPDFAIICAFFDRFSDLCGIEKQDTKQLIEWLQNTDDVHPELAELHMKLLRKLRKTVHAPRWEKALIKFCYMSTTMQDAWEIERFGYKKASLAVKLRVLKSLLEYQFDANVKFKNAINLTTANDLRGTPIGKDELGNAYWYFIDEKCNIFIYQENSDDETWRLVASNREEFVQLIQRLKDRVPIAPPSDDIIDEEDSSNSQPAVPLTITPSIDPPVETGDQKEEETTNKVASLKITLKNPDKDGVSEIVNKNEEEEIETKPEVTSHQSSDSPLKLTITTKGRKGTPKKLANTVEHVPEETKSLNVVKEEIAKEESPEPEIPAKKGRGGNRGRKAKSPVKTSPRAAQASKKQEPIKQETPPKNPPKRGGGARGGKRARRSGRNTRNHKASDSDEVGSEVEDPVLHVKGEGSGAENETAVPFECSEVIEESVMYFHGEGSGYESLVGNPGQNDSNKEQKTPTTPIVKQSFFFGSPGCLKNRPMTAFGSSSLFSFGGQATFGASSSVTTTPPKPKSDETKPEIDETDHKAEKVENVKSCNRFITPKPLESLPVAKLGNTQNFEDIIDDELEPLNDVKTNETEDSGCPKSTNNDKNEPENSKNNLIETPDEAPSISEQCEISYTPPLTPSNIKSENIQSNDDEKLEEKSENDKPPEKNTPPLPCKTFKTEDSMIKDEINSELSISDIPLPEDSPPCTSSVSTDVSEAIKLPETLVLSDIPLPDDEKSKENDVIVPSDQHSLESLPKNDTISEIPLPDEPKLVPLDIPLPSEEKMLTTGTDESEKQLRIAIGETPDTNIEEIPLPLDTKIDVDVKNMEESQPLTEQIKDASEESPKSVPLEQESVESITEEISLSEIPLPPEPSSEDILETSSDVQNIVTSEEKPVVEEIKNDTTELKNVSVDDDVITNDEIIDKPEKMTTDIKEVGEAKEKLTSLVPYDSEDSTSISSISEVKSVKESVEKDTSVQKDETSEQKLEGETIKSSEETREEKTNEIEEPSNEKFDEKPSISAEGCLQLNDDYKDTEIKENSKENVESKPDVEVIDNVSSSSEEPQLNEFTEFQSAVEKKDNTIDDKVTEVKEEVQHQISIEQKIEEPVETQEKLLLNEHIKEVEVSKENESHVEEQVAPKENEKESIEPISEEPLELKLEAPTLVPTKVIPYEESKASEFINDDNREDSKLVEIISADVVPEKTEKQDCSINEVSNTLATDTELPSASQTPIVSSDSQLEPPEQENEIVLDTVSESTADKQEELTDLKTCIKPEDNETPKNISEVSIEMAAKSDTSSSQALHIVESDEKSNTSQEPPKNIETVTHKEEISEKPSVNVSEPQIIEYQQKKKRARTESGSLKERILFRPQLDFIQNDVQQYTSKPEVQTPEKVDQLKIDVQPEKSSAEHSNVSSIEEQDASRGSRESGPNVAAHQQHRQFIPFEESQNANDALYASSTESSKTDLNDEPGNTQKYISKREKAMQRTTFNDFSVSKLIGNSQEVNKETKTETSSAESLGIEKSVETPPTTLHNIEMQSTSSPVKHSIESMMAKSPRSSPSPQSEQSMPLDLQTFPVATTEVVPVPQTPQLEQSNLIIAKECSEPKRSRGRGRRKASNDFDLSSPEPKETSIERTEEPPPSKKPQIIEEKTPVSEEPITKPRGGRGRRKNTPVRHEPTPTSTRSEIQNTVLETKEQAVVIENKRPRKSMTPEKTVQPAAVVKSVIEPEIISPEKIAPKLRAKALAKKSISHESPEKLEVDVNIPKSLPNSSTIQVVTESVSAPVEVNKEQAIIKDSVTDDTLSRSTRTRHKRAANEPLIETQIAKEFKADTSTTPPKVESVKPVARNRKRRISEEEARKRQTSESDNDVFDQNAEIATLPESSEDDFIAPAGGKRAKMRGKQVDMSHRKEIESRKQQEIPTTSSASEDDPLPRTRGGRQTRRSAGTSQPIVSSPPEKKKNSKAEITVTPPKDKKVEESKEKETEELQKEAKDEVHVEQKSGRRGKGKRRNEATNKNQVQDTSADVPTKEESSKTEEIAKVTDDKAPEEQTPVASPDTKKAKIETTPEKPVEPEPVQPEPKKRGGRPRKSAVAPPSDTSAATTPKKNINAVSSEIDPSNVIQTIDNDAPVRQSRRIAQAKIREEAERRKMEEIMLAQLKADNDKKKRREAKDKDFVPSGFKMSSDSDDNEDSNASGSRKRGRNKKKKDKKNWKTSDESSSEEAEEEHSDQHSEPDVRQAALKSDHEFSCESEDEDAQAVPTKRARTVKKEDQSESDDDNPEHACQKCHKIDHPEWILLCDSCDKGYHCSCLKPVLFLIPEGDWFCPPCQHNKLIEILEQKLLDFDFSTRQLELAEIHRQREEKLAAEQEAVERAEKERCEAERKLEDAKHKKSSSTSNSDDGSSESDSDDDKPLYKLRKRNQAPVTYRFNDYDDMINRAIKRDMEEVEEANQGSGNAGRGKDISTIIEADKEEKRRQSMGLEEGEPKPGDEKEPGETSESSSDDNKKPDGDSNDEPIKRPSKKSSNSKKGRKKPRRKLNQLDLSSDEDDPTDESFKGSSDNSSDEEENFSGSSAETESSLELAAYRRKAKKDGRPYATRRRRQTRIDAFINDNDSGEESDVKPIRKKKKKSDSEEFELSDDDSASGSAASEDSEDVDSEELCDDSDSESDSEYRWSKRKKKRESTGVSTQAAGKQPRKGFGKKKSGKRVEDEDKAFRAGISKKKILAEKKKDESDDSDDSDKPIRKTRGRQMHYLEDDFESSDEGIKPGVFRPDTPPEEREAFIRKQEEIKRMLAEKALATPSESNPDMKIEPATDNISIIPASVIETAKVLDADYHKIKPGQSVFDDLPDDFNPDEMDDEELAKMMEEEDFANHQLKLAGDVKNRKLKEGESPSKKPLLMPDPSVLPTNLVKLPKQMEKKLKKKKEEGNEDSEIPATIQAPIASIPTEAEVKRRDPPVATKPSHMPLHPNAPPNVTIANQGQLPAKLPPHLHQQHAPLPHPYQGPSRYPPGSLPPHIYAQMRPGIQPHPGMPGFGSGHPSPQHLASMYQQNIRSAGMPSNLNPALRSLMNMPPNLPPSPHQRHHGSSSHMNPLMAMSQMPAGTGPSIPSQMNRNVPPSVLHKDPSIPAPSVIAQVSNAQPPPMAQQPPPQQAQKDHGPPVVEDTSPVKKRGRRKKITPLRDDLPKNDPSQSIMQMKPEFKAQAPAIPSDAPKLSVVGQPQLFSLTQSAPASVITRVIPQAPTLTNIPKSSLPQPPQLYTKSPPHPSRGPNPPIIQSTGAGATSPAQSKSSPHLPSEPGRLAALHAQPPNPYRHSPSGVIYHGGPPSVPGRIYHEPVPMHHRIHHTGPPPAGTPPSGSRSPSQRPGVYPSQYPPHHIAPHQFGPYPYPGGPAPSASGPPPENRSPAHSTSSAGSPYQPPGNRTPQSYTNDEDRPRSGSAGAGSANSNSGGAGEFSGLVSYFSSQHDDLNS